MKTSRAFLVALCLVACAGRPHQMKDGSYKIDCEDTLANCTRKVSVFCHDRGGYRLLLGDEKNTLVGVEGHKKGYLVSRVVFVCSDQADPRPLKLPARASAASPEPGAASTVPAGGAERVCVPGSTQRCIGPGACEGGQACLPDGSGYGPCQCAPASTSATDTDADASTSADGGG